MTKDVSVGREALTVAPDVELWRALLNKNTFNQDLKRPTFKAFLRRAKDIDGLSVYMSGFYPVESLKGTFKECFGVAALVTHRVQAIPLACLKDDRATVEARGEAYDESHANIQGLPFYEEDVVEAERLATILVSLSENR